MTAGIDHYEEVNCSNASRVSGGGLETSGLGLRGIVADCGYVAW